MKKRKTAALLVLTLAALQLSPLTAHAENIIGAHGDGYTGEQWARLMDNTLEYDELADLVHEFNTDIGSGWDQLEKNAAILKDGINNLEEGKVKSKKLGEKAKEHYDIEGIINYTIQEKTFEAVLPMMRKSYTSLTVGRSTKNALKKAEGQITQGAQQLLLTYDSLRYQKKLLDQMGEMYAEQVRMMTDMQAQGLVTETQVLQAQTGQLTAQSNAATLESVLSSLKPTLCHLAGWPADGNPDIAEIPPVDLSLIDEMDLEADTWKAIGNNSTLISQRNSKMSSDTSAVLGGNSILINDFNRTTTGSYDGVDAKLKFINEGEEKLAVKMKELYDDVFSKKAAYEAAKLSYDAAMQTKARNERMYQLGMMSRVEYLGAQLQTTQAEVGFHTADTGLRQAIETYRWAVKGLTPIE